MLQLRENRKKTSIFASLLTLLVVGLLVWAGPANAFSIFLGEFDNNTPLAGDIITINAEIEASSSEYMQPINLSFNGGIFQNQVLCVFDAYTGESKGGCNGIEVVPVVKEGYGYGYGYGYAKTNFEYEIKINTSVFPMGKTYEMKMITTFGDSSASSFSIGAKLESENPIFNDVGFLLPGAENNSENISSVTTINNWNISGNNLQVFIPVNTTISGANGSNINVTAIQAQNLSVSVLAGLTGSVGAIQFGIPNFGLVFSNPITIKISVGNEYNNRTFGVFRSTDGLTGWEELATCTIASGICEFQTTKASYFAAASSVAVVSVLSGTGSGGSCSTEWTCGEWSECVDGSQTRVCSYRAGWCAPRSDKPLESRTCTVSAPSTTNTTELTNQTNNPNFVNTLIGNVIGTTAGRWSLGILVFLIVTGLTYWIVAKKRKVAANAPVVKASSKKSKK